MPAGSADQRLEPRTRVEAVDALQEHRPLVLRLRPDPLHRKRAVRRYAAREALGAADHSVLRVEGFEASVTQPGLVLRRPAVRRPLEKEDVNTGPVVGLEDAIDGVLGYGLRHPEPDDAAEIAPAGGGPSQDERATDLAGGQPGARR